MRIPLNELLFALSEGLDFVEKELLGITTNHGKRVAYVSSRICQAMGLSDVEVFDMACCSVLHDNSLTQYMLETGPDDYPRLENFKSHCARGERNAKAFPFAGDASGVILHHHENWDGSGFHGLKGEEIPLRSAALRVADNMDLLLRLGTPRPGLLEEARAHAREHSGTLYSPAVVDAFLSIADDDLLKKVTEERLDQSLRDLVPTIQVHLTTKEMLRSCNLFALIIDAKSPFTKNHSTGVADLVGRLAKRFGLDEQRADEVKIAAYLHDLGKLSIPLGILEKPGPLTAEEIAVMRRHAQVTGDILKEVSGMGEIARWCACHHEKLDGQGYPNGYACPLLSFECRMITCGDIYQALTEERPYRRGMNHQEAIAIMDEMVAKGEIDADIVRMIKEECGSVQDMPVERGERSENVPQI